MYYARKVDEYFKSKSFFLKFVVFEKELFDNFIYVGSLKLISRARL